MYFFINGLSSYYKNESEIMIYKLDLKIINELIGNTRLRNIYENGCSTIIKCMSEMKLLTLTYFSITEHNFLILDEIKHRLEQKIEKYTLNYNLSSIQNLCLTYASHLSKISFSIYEIDDYADEDIVTFLKYYYFLENKNVANNIYQERMAF